MEKVNYYKELPENYKEVKVIDAKEGKTTLFFLIGSTLISAAAITLGIVLFALNYDFLEIFKSYRLLFIPIILVGYIIYIILHELTHGLLYKIFTHEKLTFGMTLTVCYCGVPNLYTNRKTSLFAILAPFVTYSIVFLACIFLIPVPFVKFSFIILFGVHLGGCIGDLYGGIYMIFFNRKKKLLVNDTGPKQTFYVLENNEESK